MKKLLMSFAVFYSSLGLAAEVPSFVSSVRNYGPGDIENVEFVLRYDSHSGGDGTCSSCFHKEYKVKAGKEGVIRFPAIPLDRRSTRHSFSLKVVNTHDYFDKQWIYSCDVLNDKFKPCEEVLADDLKILSAYTFTATPLEINLTSGMPLKDWIAKIGNMNLQVHVSGQKPQYGEQLGWNSQIFGNCDADKCFMREGSILFIGDLGPSPELFYQVTAAHFPKTHLEVSGINGLEFSSKWTGHLPKGLLSFQVND